MLDGWCDSTNPKSCVILRKFSTGFVIYWDGEPKKLYKTIDEALFSLQFIKDFIKNPVRVLAIAVPAEGPIEVVDWVRSAP